MPTTSTQPMSTGASSERQAAVRAVQGLVVQALVAGCLMALARWAHSDVCEAAARFAVMGLLVWFTLVLVFKQLQRVRDERIEAEELRRTRDAGTDPALFEIDEEALHIERRKFDALVRWLIPATSLILALYATVGSFLFWKWSFTGALESGAVRRAQHGPVVMTFLVGAGFISFLWGRFAAGLARHRDWRAMRAGAAHAMGTLIVCGIAVLALALTRTFPSAEPLAAYVVRALTLILGFELLAFFIADFYRPRQLGAFPRPSFDSRMLGLITEPGGIAKSIADAVNYQFGFEVSKTWFYQLLAATLLPLGLFTVAAIVLLSSVVIIDADEAAIVERFGRPISASGDILGPGVHLKLPWPIERVRRAPIKRLNSIVIGDTPTEPAKDAQSGREKAVLWTETHKFQAEMLLIVGHSSSTPGEAPAAESDQSQGRSVAVNAVMASVPITYRIVDLGKYLNRYEAPEQLLECLAYRKLSDYAATTELETLMGPGRRAFNERLHADLQQEVDRADLGLQIVSCGLESVHPPSEQGVAAAFQKVISAEATRLNAIYTAEGDAERMLTEVVGSRTRALALDEAIQAREALLRQGSPDPAQLTAQTARVELLLLGDPATNVAPVGGEAVAHIADARQSSEKLVSDVAAKVKSFTSEVKAYEASPELYKARKQLEMLVGLDSVRKYLVIGDASRLMIEWENVEAPTIDLGEKK